MADPVQPAPIIPSRHREKVVVAVAAIVIAALALYWFFVLQGREAVAPGPEAGLIPAEEAQGLGEQISEEVANPIEGELPAVAPEVNPIEDLYKNPFE